MQHITKPTFSSERAAWPTFQKRWEQYYRICQEMVPGGVSDALLLELLRNSLDETNRLELERRLEEEEELEYATFWEELKEEYSDIRRAHKRAWKAVKVSLPLTTTTWKKYRKEFELLKGRVEDWTQ